MSDKKANIMMVILFGIITLFWVMTNVSITITRKYSDSTYIICRDGLKGEVYWSTRYKAPLLLPKEIKSMAKEKIKVYADMTLKSFFLVRLSHPLSDQPVSTIQSEFNEQDELQRKFAEMFEMRGFEKLKNLQDIKIDSIRFEDHQEPNTFINTITSLWK